MTEPFVENLDDLKAPQLIDEIKQIVEQYSREVPTARRTWPNSVRNRVLALARLSVPRNRISKECGIPSTTVFLWCETLTGRKPRTQNVRKKTAAPAQARFLTLESGSDTSHSNPTVGMGIEPEKRQIQMGTALGFQIVLPGGIEVRGLSSIDQILALYRGCRA